MEDKSNEITAIPKVLSSLYIDVSCGFKAYPRKSVCEDREYIITGVMKHASAAS
ncbi:hypothetical protein Barb7_02391 [Bacteroidales bacterium Barb7]|nr:hypothetical protein Barb7_02391 [Bacteroidales bacterium Barb7]